MWELIRANKRNSIILMTVMAAVLLGLGYLIASAFAGPQYGFTGLIIASGIWFLLTIVSFAAGDQILLSSSKAINVTHEDYPQLFNVVEEMKIAAGLPKMPEVYIIPDQSLNAFATGRSPQKASIAVTAGLLSKLNREELQGVIAHEVSHILNRDILYVTLAGIMLGSISLMSQIFLRSLYYGSGNSSQRRYSSSSSSQGGGGQAVLFVLVLVAAILAPIMAQLLYFALSRQREYLADAGGARLTRNPEGLAKALEKIAYDNSPVSACANKATAPMYISNPFKRGFSGLTSTHPAIEERIKILRNMAHGASFKNYSQAYETVTHRHTIIPKQEINEQDVSLSSAESKAEKPNQKASDIIRMLNGFAFITCPCGLKMKIPANYKASSVTCPKCKTNIAIKPN